MKNSLAMCMCRNYYSGVATVKVGIVQMISSASLEANLQKMRSLVEVAKVKGATVIAFPEMAYFSGSRREGQALAPRFTELLGTFSEWAKELEIFLVPGTLREPVPGLADKCFNTCPLIDPHGKIIAQYRKIFLFRAVMPDRTYEESAYAEPGKQLVTASGPGVRVGLSICFDLRFPELFRGLRCQGAQMIFLPSAFTVPTGKAHWSVLTRARAIENQVFIVAPGQTGRNGDGAETYGHSTIVSPWGEVIAEMESEEGVTVAELDLDEITRCEGKVSAWACRREELFPLPPAYSKTDGT